MNRLTRERLGWLLATVAFLLLIALVTFSYVSIPEGDRTKEVINNVAGNVGLPAAALTSFVIVIALWSIFPPKYEGEIVQVDAFGLKFSGPAGPITLWVVCFLAIVVGIWLLKLK